jgi:hypothetical protein
VASPRIGDFLVIHKLCYYAIGPINVGVESGFSNAVAVLRQGGPSVLLNPATPPPQLRKEVKQSYPDEMKTADVLSYVVGPRFVAANTSHRPSHA